PVRQSAAVLGPGIMRRSDETPCSHIRRDSEAHGKSSRAWGTGRYDPAMKLFLAILVWLIMGAIIGTDLLWAVNGSPWLLFASVIGFIVAVGKIGCATH